MSAARDLLRAKDLADASYGDYETLKSRGVEFSQEPTETPYGVDAGFRDPFGNHFRLTQTND